MNRVSKTLKCLLLLVVVGALTVPPVTAMPVGYDLDDYWAGELATHRVAFELTDRSLPSNGKIKIHLPDGFNISEASLAFIRSNCGCNDGSYTLEPDISTTTLVLVRDGGDDYPVGVTVGLRLYNIRNPDISGEKIIEVSTTTSGDSILDIGTARIPILPGHATHLNVTTIDSQVAGTAFPITVNALDLFGNVDTSYTGTATLASSIGTISPDTIVIVDGTGTESVTIRKTGTGNITATDAGLGSTGTSNTFTVTPAALGSFNINRIQDQFDQLEFTVTAQAVDEFGNNKTDYNAVDALTVAPGVPGTVTIVSPSPATVQFVNGAYSGRVTLDVVPDPTPAALQTGVSLTVTNVTLHISGTSNDFSISLPVDVKNSTVAANPAVVIEDGVSTSVITVTVKNGINQGVIPGATVVLKSDRVRWMDSIVPASNTTDSNGQTKFTITSYYSGKVNLTATVWGTEELEQKAVVTFGFDELLHLNRGWNLVSVPRQLADSSISAISGEVDTIYYYDAANGKWRYAFYNNGSWSGDLTTIDDGKGYWMNATSPVDVPVVLKKIDQLQFPPSYPLKAGWNMVGYTSFASLDLYDGVYEYFFSLRHPDSGFPIWVSAYRWTGARYEQAKPTGGDFGEVVRTQGYWLYLNQEGTLVP